MMGPWPRMATARAGEVCSGCDLRERLLLKRRPRQRSPAVRSRKVTQHDLVHGAPHADSFLPRSLRFPGTDLHRLRHGSGFWKGCGGGGSAASCASALYRMAEEHREALAGSLRESAGATWQWLGEGSDPAMAYPTDFGVLKFSNSEAQSVKRALESLEFVKDVHPQMAHTRSLMFEDPGPEMELSRELRTGPKTERRTKKSRRHKASEERPEGSEDASELG